MSDRASGRRINTRNLKFRYNIIFKVSVKINSGISGSLKLPTSATAVECEHVSAGAKLDLSLCSDLKEVSIKKWEGKLVLSSQYHVNLIINGNMKVADLIPNASILWIGEEPKKNQNSLSVIKQPGNNHGMYEAESINEGALLDLSKENHLESVKINVMSGDIRLPLSIRYFECLWLSRQIDLSPYANIRKVKVENIEKGLGLKLPSALTHFEGGVIYPQTVVDLSNCKQLVHIFVEYLRGKLILAKQHQAILKLKEPARNIEYV